MHDGNEPDPMVDPFRLDSELAQALDGFCEAMNVTRENGICLILREYLTSLGALDYKELDDDTPTIGSA
ncbi:MAG: hypothetical protein WDZ83_04165 [Rhizobiaceae bacterium]